MLGVVAAQTTPAQKPPAVRGLGPIERVSAEPMASVTSAAVLADGRVYVNDIVARRVLLFDSTLATVRVVADSTAATAKAYGARPGTLIAFRGDSVLFIDPASGSMLVFSSDAKIDRIMAMPRTDGGAPFQINGAFGFPGFDARGRMVSIVPVAAIGPGYPPTSGTHAELIPDSEFVVRFDFPSRRFDTVAVVRAPWLRITIGRNDDGRITSMAATPDLLPLVDEWALRPDGSIAIVRGHDFHVDVLGADGRWTSAPKMPFDWQHLDDGQKTTLIDSSLAVIKARRDSMDAVIAARPPIAAPDGGGGRGGRGGGGGGGPAGPPPAFIDVRPGLEDIPDYKPPFTRGSTRADADGNLWIRTTTIVKGQPVYDIVNARGELVDRVQLPPFRTIAGFGPGVVYMAVKDPTGVVHLERARVK
ncbi:MAG TPA: hypothetical protein VHV78_18030 [Gemmatimonadaceae bacterium]|nr:hypothetical protein [Gemmatimonadaceae bacterium]